MSCSPLSLFDLQTPAHLCPAAKRWALRSRPLSIVRSSFQSQVFNIRVRIISVDVHHLLLTCICALRPFTLTRFCCPVHTVIRAFHQFDSCIGSVYVQPSLSYYNHTAVHTVDSDPLSYLIHHVDKTQLVGEEDTLQGRFLRVSLQPSAHAGSLPAELYQLDGWGCCSAGLL